MATETPSKLGSIIKKYTENNQQTSFEHTETHDATYIKDNLKLMVIAKKLQELKIVVSEEYNTNKVNEIKAALKADRYTWDPERVADSLLNLDRELAETE